MRTLKVGMRIRIIDSAGINFDQDSSIYYDIGPGATITVKHGDLGDHESDTHKDQQCFRGRCSILWQEIKKPTIIIG